jgi:DNA-directed RNA polymerase alpha subunit
MTDGSDEYAESLRLAFLIDNARVLRLLVRKSVFSIGALVDCSEADLKCIGGMGAKSIKHIKQVLSELDLELKS